MPPLLFAATSTLLASAGAFVYLLASGKVSELRKRSAYRALFMVSLCIVIIPYTLFFIGASLTSGLNTSLLLLAEIVFTVLFTPFIGEKTTNYKIIGAFGVLIGAVVILYNGSNGFGLGDFLIILSTLTYPVGNFYSKKALNEVSSATIIFTRFLLGGIFIALFAFLFGQTVNLSGILSAHWLIILFNGLIVLGFSKIIWYESLKRLDISKAISLAMTFPFFSLLVLVGLGEKISALQICGIIIMAFGVIFTVLRPSTDQALTKYAKN